MSNLPSSGRSHFILGLKLIYLECTSLSLSDTISISGISADTPFLRGTSCVLVRLSLPDKHPSKTPAGRKGLFCTQRFRSIMAGRVEQGRATDILVVRREREKFLQIPLKGIVWRQPQIHRCCQASPGFPFKFGWKPKWFCKFYIAYVPRSASHGCSWDLCRHLGVPGSLSHVWRLASD